MEFFANTDIRIFLVLVAFFYFIVSFVNISFGFVTMILAMLFSPEFSVGGFGERAITLRIEDLLIPVLILAWVARAAQKRELGLFIGSPLSKPVMALLGMSAISTLWGVVMGRVDAFLSFFYILKTLQFFLVFFLVVTYVRTIRQVNIFLFFVILTLVFVVGFTLSQVPTVEVFTENRITAPFEGEAAPATIGGYLAFLILIVFSLFLYAQKKREKIFLGLLGVAAFIPFLFTYNRTSYAVLILGLVFITFCVKRTWLNWTMALFLVTSPFWAPPSVKDRIAFTWEDAANPGRELGVDMSFQERIYAYKKMWPSFKQSPVIGWGVTSFLNPDSQYAVTLHEIGVVGLILWLWIFFRLGKMSHWLFATLDNGLLKGFVLGYRAGLVGLLLHCFGTVTLYIVRIMEPFWFISGLMVALYLIKSKQWSFAPAGP